MRSLKLCLLLAFLFSPVFLHAQQWVEMMEDPRSDFYDIQTSFNDYFKTRPQGKGTGWKQFKRWEYFMEPRVYPSGRLPVPTQAWNEHMKFKSKYPGSMNLRSSGNWTPLGPTSWTSTGWNPGIGRVNCIAEDPSNSQVIYIGAPAGGCWKSADGGNTWSTTTDNLPILGVQAIAIDPGDPSTVYIATGDGDGSDTYSIGVLKSTDGGSTWNTTGLNWNTTAAKQIHRLIIDPANPQILFAATTNGLFRSSDSAGSWALVLGGNIRDIKLKPGNSAILYASNNNFYKSVDGGQSFTMITSGLPSPGDINRALIAVTPANPEYVYLVCGSASDAGFYGFYQSVNSGDSFTLKVDTPNFFGYSDDGSSTGGQSWYDMAIAASATNPDEVYIGGINVWKTTDGGDSFRILTHWVHPSTYYGYVHADIHTLEVFGNNLYCGSDGGIFLSADTGDTWTDITTGIQITQFYRIGGSATDPGMIIGGTQDNGTNLRSFGFWRHVLGADGMEAAIDYDDPLIMYGCIQGGALRRSTDGGFFFTDIVPTASESGAWVTPYVLHPDSPNVLFAGYENIWKTSDRGDSWDSISFFGNSTTFRTLAVAPSNPDYLYASKSNLLYMTDNQGQSWTDITSGLPNNFFSYLAIHPNDPQKVWVTLSGYDAGEKVYYTDDGGGSWTNVSGNLPNLPVNCIAYQNGSADGLYVGTDIGIYYTDTTLANWQPFMDGLPNVIVNELEIHYGSGMIRAATYGRGLWESDLFTPVLAPPTAQFDADRFSICPGDSIRFTDQSLDAAPGWQWSFSGGTPAISADQHPVITYDSTGLFDVTLTVNNGFGPGTLTKTAYIEVTYPVSTVKAVKEGFESPVFAPASWTIGNPDNDPTWEASASAGGHGLSLSSAVMNNFGPDIRDTRDHLISPSMDFTSSDTGSVCFDYAYARYSWFYTDTLAIYATTDCGATKQLLWLKGNTDLSTAPDTSGSFVPLAGQWVTDTIPLDAFMGLSGVQLIFENRSGWGNNLYLDNINIKANGLEPFSVKEKDSFAGNILVYPNPSSGQFLVSTGTVRHSAIAVRCFNSTGAVVWKRTLPAGPAVNFVIDLSGLSPGIYSLSFEVDGELISRKIVKI